MSFLITIYVREGIVMASDSRTTFSRKQADKEDAPGQMGIHYSDTTYKTFLTPNNIGISVCGAADIEGAPIGGYIESFIRERITEDVTVDQVPDLLLDHFGKFEPIPQSQFLVAGYKKDEGKMEQQVWNIRMQGKKKTFVNKNLQGATWAGEGDVMGRFFTNVYSKKEEEYIKLPGSKVAWGYFTLQDAIDFAVYAVRTTIDTMRFQLRYKTVGGPVDVLVIKPDRAFWAARKELGVK